MSGEDGSAGGMNSMQRTHRPGADLPIAGSPVYEQGELGPIPSDWEITTLGALGRTLSGGTPSSSDARFWGGDIPWISSKDMKVSRLHDAVDHVTPLALGNGTRLVPPGTILMVVRGMSLAHSFPVAIVEKPVAFNQDLKAFVPHPAVDGEFILRWLRSQSSQIAPACYGGNPRNEAHTYGGSAGEPSSIAATCGTTRNCRSVVGRGRVARSVGGADRQEARNQAGRDAATPYRRDPPAGLQRRVEHGAIG